MIPSPPAFRDSAGPAADARVPTGEGTGLRFLVVEGNPRHRDYLVAALRDLGGFDLEIVAEGRAGAHAMEVAERPFDVVIADLEMDGMDGLEFMRHAIRRGVAGIILASALDESVRSAAEWVARAYRAPLLGVLPKPIAVPSLASALNRLDGSQTNFSDVLADGASPDCPEQRALDDIRDALDTGQFVPHYQPKVSLKTGAVTGVEILARWDHPELGLRLPVQFIDLMESGGLIEPLTFTILEQAARHANAWRREGRDVPLALNVSPKTLEQPNAAGRLLQGITRGGLQASSVTIEITEQALAQDTTTLIENVLRLRMQGCKIAVDDFGTGYSSMQQLTRVPVTELKIDRSFVRRMARNSKALSVVTSMITLAHQLGLESVAEGIDNEQQRRMLVGLGCDVGQGFLIAKPMDAEQFSAWHDARLRAAA